MAVDQRLLSEELVTHIVELCHGIVDLVDIDCFRVRDCNLFFWSFLCCCCCSCWNSFGCYSYFLGASVVEEHK